MKFLVVLACIATVAARNADWENFKAAHGKRYESESEEQQRLAIFLVNLKTIEEHNTRYESGHVAFTLRVNRFSDMTTEEFASKMNGYKQNPNPPKGILLARQLGSVGLSSGVPDTVDWRNAGYVTPVKDQGHCGSCWAFSATGSLEGQHFAATGKLVSLSEQNLMDCSWNYGNEGCAGGFINSAFQYIIDNNGDDTEAAYPYEMENGQCRYDPNQIGATAYGLVNIPPADENALKNAVGTVGPVAVAIDASHISFQQYSSGVYSEPGCSQIVLDHSVLVVGYGSDSGTDYWLVKNSWGEDWGMQGYIEMSRNKNNQCGIATEASYPVVSSIKNTYQ